MSSQLSVSEVDNKISEWTVIDVYTFISSNNDSFGLNQDDLDSIEECPLNGKELITKDDEQLSQEWAISIHSARKIIEKMSLMHKKTENIELNGGNDIMNRVHYESPPKQRISLSNIPEEQTATHNDSYLSRITPKYTQSTTGLMNEEIKLTLNITNDTFMGRLSHPKWWMDGHFNHIPNKIAPKHSISIDICGDIDTPLVGLLSFTLTLDPRFKQMTNNNHSKHAFSPFLNANSRDNHHIPHIPPWMIGAGGLPYIPPSVMRLYQLQHQYIQKINENTKQKQIKMAENHRKQMIKQERKRMKQKAKQNRRGIKLEKRKLKTLQKQQENEDNNDKKDEEMNTLSIITKTEIESEDETEESESTTETESEDETEDEIDIEEAPKYRLIILWSITAQDKGKTDRRTDIALNSMAMMSVASSDLLHCMNRFNVLLFEDDTDPNNPDEFILDNSYFNELEQAALIADIEQCLVEHEHFEIAATFGTSALNNTHTLTVDIDDSLGEWPSPLPQFNSINPFALGFTPLSMYPSPHINNTSYTQQSSHSKELSAPKHSRKRSSSHPIKPFQIENEPTNLVTLDEVLTVSRSPVPGQRSSGLLSPNAMISAYNNVRRKSSKAGTKAQPLSIWKEQMHSLHELHHSPRHQQRNSRSKNSNLYVPRQYGQQQHNTHQSVSNRNGSPHISPMPPSSPHLEHASTVPTAVYHHIEYNIGDCVFVEDSKLGQIKSIGQHPAWGKGVWYGIRLTENIGNCDGEFKGQRTFSCPSGYGYFVQRNQLTQKLNTTRFDFMNEDYIEDKKKEFETLKAAKDHDSFAAEIKSQKQPDHGDASDEDPGESDIPKPGTNVSQIMGQSSSERILSKNKPSGKYVAKFEKPQKKEKKQEEEKPRRKSKPHAIVAQWTGGAPRTIVVRNKIPPIKEHTGYLHCKEGVQFQREMEWKKAIEKFKLGIALLEVTLNEIDRSMIKRKWKAQIEEFRHKMSRCTFEIQNNKRNRFIKKRDKIAKQQAAVQREAELRRQAAKLSDAQSKVMKREDNWKVTREDMEKKVQENEIDPNYDPSTGIRKSDAVSDSDSDEVNKGRIGGDKALAKAKKEHRKKKKKKGKKEDWSKFPGFENSGNNNKKDSESDDDDDDDDKKKKKKDNKKNKYDNELRSRIEGDVMNANPNLSFSDVIGLNNVKLALYETIILPYIRPDLFEDVSKSTQGLLLFGPPGNGKTMIAKCVASQCDATFFSISASSITSKWVGEAERIMRTLFNMARQRAPSIIFIDEIDSLLRTRGGANEAESSRRIKTEFLIQFDGVKSTEAEDKTITIIGATNLPDQLDDAVLRRFPKRIMVPNPDAEARYSLIRLLMSKHRHNMTEEEFRELSLNTDHYSCSDIAMVCSDAVMGPLRSMRGSILLKAKKSDIPKINKNHFMDSLKNVRASCAPSAIQQYFKWDEQFGSKLFLTMDVLPENMKQKPLLSVEDEKRKKQEAEDAIKRKERQAKEAEIAEKERALKEEEERLEQQRLAKEEHEKKQSKLLKINSSSQPKQRRKSDNAFRSKRKSGSGTPKKHQSRTSGSFSMKPTVLDSKTFKISTNTNGNKRYSRSRSSHVGSPSAPDVFIDKKKLWNKRSSKIGTEKKKKIKK